MQPHRYGKPYVAKFVVYSQLIHVQRALKQGAEKQLVAKTQTVVACFKRYSQLADLLQIVTSHIVNKSGGGLTAPFDPELLALGQGDLEFDDEVAHMRATAISDAGLQSQIVWPKEASAQGPTASSSADSPNNAPETALRQPKRKRKQAHSGRADSADSAAQVPVAALSVQGLFSKRACSCLCHSSCMTRWIPLAF